MERAASTQRAAHLRPLDAVQGALFLNICFQFIAATPKPVPYDSGVLADSMASTWWLRQQRAMKTSIPSNCPCGSARTCRVAPFHFRPPIAGLVLSPHICNPLQSHVGPQQQDQSACSQESCHPCGPPWGQHVPGVRPPSTFGRILQPGSSSLHVHMPDSKLLL
jgi:hypothetical protein